MSARIYDRQMFFAAKRVEADVARVIAIAEKAAADDAILFVHQVVARTKAAIDNERQLSPVISGCDWFDRAPSECEPFSDGRT